MLKNYRELNLIKNGRVLLIHMIDRRCEMNTMNAIVRELLSKNNFKFKRHSWYRLYSDITQIINFQRSQWSDFYYCNVGIDMRHETDIFLPEYKFPIRMRAGRRATPTTQTATVPPRPPPRSPSPTLTMPRTGSKRLAATLVLV